MTRPDAESVETYGEHTPLVVAVELFLSFQGALSDTSCSPVLAVADQHQFDTAVDYLWNVHFQASGSDPQYVTAAAVARARLVQRVLVSDQGQKAGTEITIGVEELEVTRIEGPLYSRDGLIFESFGNRTSSLVDIEGTGVTWKERVSVEAFFPESIDLPPGQLFLGYMYYGGGGLRDFSVTVVGTLHELVDLTDFCRGS